MTHNIIFISICFFTLGFIGITGLITLFLNYFFKVKSYSYYLGYLVSTALYIIIVFLLHLNILPAESIARTICEYAYDPFAVIMFFMQSLFVFNSMVQEDEWNKRFYWLMNIYGIIVLGRILIALFYPNIILNNSSIHIVSRTVVLLISFIIYYQLFKQLTNVYFRFLFAGSTILFLFILLAIWDNTINKENSEFKGFQYISIGIVLENLCFAAAFIYKIMESYKQKKADEILHQTQLIIVEQEMQQQTMQYLGREIHDNVGQKLILASIGVQQLSLEKLAPQLIKKMEDVNNTINTALSELRLLSQSLINNDIENKNIITLVKSETNEVNKIKKCTFLFDDELGSIKLEYQTKTILLRIIQEFTQNSIKHANCNLIKIELIVVKNFLHLCLADDGHGFDIETITYTGMGLKNIKKRTALIGATFSLKSNVKLGTKLLIEIPL
jgi:signal transduction histidine kinase